jgi:ATP-dependent exoDNAse (exonuclease V) beta subunit
MRLVSGVAGRSPSGWLKRLDAALPLGERIKEITTENTERTEADTETWEVRGQLVRCTVYPEGVELSALGSAGVRAAEIEPYEPLDLPETPPLLVALTSEAVVADEEAREEARDPPRHVWRVVPPGDRTSAPAWVVGQIVHGALEAWLFPDPGPHGGASYERWAQAEAKGCGITDDREIHNALQRARRILARFQGTPLYTRMQAADARLHEVPYSRIDEEGRLEHGVIDALFREGEAWTLVEFKTDWIQGPDMLEEKLATRDYVPQVARYLAAVEGLLGVRPRPVLCLLNVERTVHLVEDRWP